MGEIIVEDDEVWAWIIIVVVGLIVGGILLHENIDLYNTDFDDCLDACNIITSDQSGTSNQLRQECVNGCKDFWLELKECDINATRKI
jgi:hypothetical protein